MLTAKSDPELVQQLRRNHQAVVVVQLVFAVFSVDSSLREDEAADAAILLREVAIIAAKRAGVIDGKLAGHTGREIRVALRVGYVLLKQPGGGIGEHHVLQILLFAVCGDHERCLTAIAERANQTSFKNAALLRRPYRREGVPRIQMIIAKDEIKRPMIIL